MDLRVLRQERSGGLRARLLALTDEAAQTLGFPPALRMTGAFRTAPRDPAGTSVEWTVPLPSEGGTAG